MGDGGQPNSSNKDAAKLDPGSGSGNIVALGIGSVGTTSERRNPPFNIHHGPRRSKFLAVPLYSAVAVSVFSPPPSTAVRKPFPMDPAFEQIACQCQQWDTLVHFSGNVVDFTYSRVEQNDD